MWYDSPFPVRTDPEFRMYLILRDDLASENVSHKEVVVHGLRDDFSNLRRVELNEGVVF